MAKQTIIDWQSDGLIIATCSGKAETARLEAVSFQPISATTEGAPADATAAIARAVADLGLGKGDVTVVAPRNRVEVRTISVPRIDTDDLPDVIRFQAQRQLANMGDSWSLDFILLPDDPGHEMRTALVGAIAPQQLNAIQEACNAANLQVAHVALRPIEIARYALSTIGSSQSGAFLIVCLSDQTADIILVRSGQVVLLRTTQVPSEAEAVPRAIAGEIRRSLLAASGQLGNHAVEGCVLIGTPAISGNVEQAIADTLDTSVTTLDPTLLLPANHPDRDHLAMHSAGRVAAIAGASGLSTADPATVIDLKNPKKRPPPKNRTVQYALAGVAAVLLMGAGFSWWSRTNRELDEELARIEEEIESKQQLVELSKAKVTELNEVKQFLASSPNFLDELVVIANKMPPAEQVIVEEPQFNVLSDGSGRLQFNLKADKAETISAFENALRDEGSFNVEGRDNRLSANPTPLYKWEATELITIPNRGWNLLEAVASSNASPSTTSDPAEDEATGAANENADVSESEEAPPVTAETPEPAEAATSPGEPIPETAEADEPTEEAPASEPNDTKESAPESEPQPNTIT